MAKTVEVPDQLHDALVSRAQEEGVSVADLIARELEKQVTTYSMLRANRGTLRL